MIPWRIGGVARAATPARELLYGALMLQECSLLRRSSWVGCALLVAGSLGACGGKSQDAGEVVGASAGASAGVGTGPSGGAGGTASTTARLTRGGWDVTTTFTPMVVEMPGVSSTPGTLTFTLDLLDDGDTLSAILGSDGNGVAFPLQRTSATRAALQTTLVEPLGGGLLSSLGGQILALNYDTLQLTASDSDADGVADQLTGMGTGSIQISCGDCEYSSPVDIQLAGTPDKTAPHLYVPVDTLDPLAAWTVSASEPLASAKLSLTGNSIVALPSTRDDATLIEFGTQQVLPFSGTWQVTGSGYDFASNPLDLSQGQVTTLTDPGAFIQDGFESAVHAALSGDPPATVVDASSGLPIPAGAHALLLPPAASATFHLTRQPGQSRLSFTVVELWGPGPNASAFGRFQAGVIGGTDRVTLDWTRSATINATTNAKWTRASAPAIASATITEAGADVVVVLVIQSSAEPSPPPGALLIDDLTLQ